MTSFRDDKVLEHFLREIRNRLGEHLKEVILFGSRARGDNVPGSDYDCLAVLDEVSPRTKDIIDEVAGELLFQYNALFSIFPLSEEEHKRRVYDPFLRNVHKEGIVL